MSSKILTNELSSGSPRLEAVSSLGLTATAMVLHVAVFAGRLPVPRLPGRPVAYISWQAPRDNPLGDSHAEDNVPSNPIHTYCAGHLALVLGMAVIALTAWLQIMRISGALGL